MSVVPAILVRGREALGRYSVRPRASRRALSISSPTDATGLARASSPLRWCRRPMPARRSGPAALTTDAGAGCHGYRQYCVAPPAAEAPVTPALTYPQRYVGRPATQ
jgi:hypothetical protein